MRFAPGFGRLVLRDLGGVPKWPTGADCKSAGLRLRRFESFPHHGGSMGRVFLLCRICGSSSVGRALAFQACGRGFESRLPLPGLVLVSAVARVAQLVEHTLGKGEVIGSIPIASSEWFRSWFFSESGCRRSRVVRKRN